MLTAGAVLVPLWGGLAAEPRFVLPAVLLGWLLFALAVCDFRAFVLPDALTLALAMSGLLTLWLLDSGAIGQHLAAMAAGGAGLVAAGTLYRLIRGRDGLGLGDAKLLAASGAWITVEGLATVVLVGSLAGLAHGLALAHLGRRQVWTEPVPLGAFLCLGLWVTWLHGPIALTGFGSAP